MQHDSCDQLRRRAVGGVDSAGPIPGHAAGVVPDTLQGRSRILPARRAGSAPTRSAGRPRCWQFAGVRPGDRVADFMSGGAYFTRLFSRIVGKTGHVYAFLPEEQLKNCAPEETAGTRVVEHDGSYANVSVMTGRWAGSGRPSGRPHLDVTQFPRPVRLLHGAGGRAAGHAGAVRRAEARRRAAGDRPRRASRIRVRDTETLHRIDPKSSSGARKQRDSGSKRTAMCCAIRTDTHQLRVFDAAVRGQTDQVILKFRKPFAPTPATPCDDSRDRHAGTRPGWL